MDELEKEVHQYRKQHGYPEYEEELLKCVQHFYNMGFLSGQKIQVV